MKKTSEIKIAIISSSFRAEVTENLEKYCIATFKKKGVTKSQIDIFRVPGSLEIPLIARKVAKKNTYDAIITFGAIVKGKTYHFEQIANECARGCMDVSLEYEIPVIFEVLAVYDMKDAIERATRKKENKGVEGALTALKMIDLMAKL
ncbi:6,7-dimethyl-8-ribityllumazine synthase [Candidatus Gottesmanbacteria bacterium]|nr:6,7-dimethyl-8-ribityllumazine synthase [Candidatus Gottesmanbacteria bacterium]